MNLVPQSIIVFEKIANMVQIASKSISIIIPTCGRIGAVSTFPEHARSHLGNCMHTAVFSSKIPEHCHSTRQSTTLPISIFRSMPVHFFYLWDYLYVSENLRHKGAMAGIITDMSKIKQVLIMHKNGTSNRQIAKAVELNKCTINDYIKKSCSDSFTIDELVKLSDPELESRFFQGNPAYTDNRMKDFLHELPYYKEQLTNKHVTRFLLWEEYRSRYPYGYGKSQFFHHLKQNLVAEKTPVSVLSNHYEAGKELFIDFAGDTLSYIDSESGEEVKCQVFVASLPYTDFGYAVCVPCQRVEHFLFGLRMCLESIGGVPKIVVPDNLKSAVIKADGYEPRIKKALEDMDNHYGFAVIPARVIHPRDKALVESTIRRIYNRVYAKLRHCTFFSLSELNEAVTEKILAYNQTRMQQRPYSRQEHFHASEKDKLNPLPEHIYEMKFYANEKVSPSGTVLLSRDSHYYSVPYTLIGRRAKIIYTRSTVQVFVDNKSVATHLRIVGFGHSLIREHLSPNTLAYTDRSPEFYCERAKSVSPVLESLFQTMFMNRAPGVVYDIYYRTCEKMLKIQQNTSKELFNSACEICKDNHMFKAESLDGVIKSLQANCLMEEPEDNDILPNNHENTRGATQYK